MKRQDIGISDFKLASFNAWNPDSLLLTAGGGGPGQYNCMTVAWGSIGFIWKRPFVCVVVRPSRFTYSFIESHRDFTLSSFPPQHREILKFCGSHSGRDVDKVAMCGLTPVESSKVEAPGFDQAELIIECRKVYYDDLEPAHFLDASILDNYPKKDFHRMYFGEILAIRGTDKYILNR